MTQKKKKKKQTRVETVSNIYRDVFDELKNSPHFEHGLSYAVNAELAEKFGLPLPPTPGELKSASGKTRGAKKNPHVFVLEADWYERLETLLEGGTFRLKEMPRLGKYAAKYGLVVFKRNYGAEPTEKLLKMLRGSNPGKTLAEYIRTQADEAGYSEITIP